jgi:hypothetical protein
MCKRDTFKNKHPVKVEPIARSKGLFLNYFDLIGRVPTKITIKKKAIITMAFKIGRSKELLSSINWQFIL